MVKPVLILYIYCSGPPKNVVSDHHDFTSSHLLKFFLQHETQPYDMECTLMPDTLGDLILNIEYEAEDVYSSLSVS